MGYGVSLLAILESSGFSSSLLILRCQPFEMLLFWWGCCCKYRMLDILLLSYRFPRHYLLFLSSFPSVVWIKSFLYWSVLKFLFLSVISVLLLSPSLSLFYFSYCVFQPSFFFCWDFSFCHLFQECLHCLLEHFNKSYF